MTATATPARGAFVILHAGERRFALPAGIVSELAPPLRLHTFPHTSPLVSGVIVRRGRIVPVYDAAPLLPGATVAAQRFYLIARRSFGAASELSAIPVDGEGELATGEMAPPATGQPDYVLGTLAVEGNPLDVIDLGALIAAQEARGNARKGGESKS